jgi:capsid protein
LSRESHRAQDDPKRWVNAFPADYWRHDLLVNAWDYTDPVSEAQSDLLQMTMGTKSPQMVITERGRDAKQIKADFQKWGELAALSSMTRDKTPVAPAAPAEPTNNEDDANADQ